MVLQIATTMEYLHHHKFVIGVRSLDNILMQLNACHHVAKITDFGGFTQGKSTSAVDVESFAGIAIQILGGEILAKKDLDKLDLYPNELISFLRDCMENSHNFDFLDILRK